MQDDFQTQLSKRMRMSWQIERLKKTHDRSVFSSGNTSLDDFLRLRVSQYEKRNLGRTFVATLSTNLPVQGYYTLAATSIPVEGLPTKLASKLPGPDPSGNARLDRANCLNWRDTRLHCWAMSRLNASYVSRATRRLVWWLW
jgi:hypothetical protein